MTNILLLPSIKTNSISCIDTLTTYCDNIVPRTCAPIPCFIPRWSVWHLTSTFLRTMLLSVIFVSHLFLATTSMLMSGLNHFHVLLFYLHGPRLMFVADPPSCGGIIERNCQAYHLSWYRVLYFIVYIAHSSTCVGLTFIACKPYLIRCKYWDFAHSFFCSLFLANIFIRTCE